jgi:hypothetical protein
MAQLEHMYECPVKGPPLEYTFGQTFHVASRLTRADPAKGTPGRSRRRPRPRNGGPDRGERHPPPVRQRLTWPSARVALRPSAGHSAGSRTPGGGAPLAGPAWRAPPRRALPFGFVNGRGRQSVPVRCSAAQAAAGLFSAAKLLGRAAFRHITRQGWPRLGFGDPARQHSSRDHERRFSGHPGTYSRLSWAGPRPENGHPKTRARERAEAHRG